jgi:hypothetical protein
MDIAEGRRAYTELSQFVALRTNELSQMLEPFTRVTDRYGELICEICLVLGKVRPSSKRDAAMRDLMADVFDFLVETRPLITKGKVEIAYPLARRAYESLSLMVACHLDEGLANRWMAGKQIGNAEVRRILGQHPMGEPQELTQDLYSFFSKTSHPNREQIAYRFLGDGNEFVLGAIGRPSLTLLADYALKTLNLWFWFGAVVSFIYKDIVERADPDFHKTYHDVSEPAELIARWLTQQFNRVLRQEQAERANIKSQTKRETN